MGAKIVKIKNNNKEATAKPLSPLQKKLLAGPVMTNEEYKEFRKMNKWMEKWKI
jgi:hypothetical protein